jgi:GNAT superfamily N-acetyltransferase
MAEAPYIRLAGPEDAGTVADLLCAFRDWFGYGEPSDADMRASVERLVADPNTEFLLGGRPAAGVCQLRYRYGVWKSAEDCCLEDLYVRDDARATGLGHALVEAAIKRAGTRGCRRIELDVNSANAPARALYEAAGFAGDSLFLRRPLP